MLSAKPGTEHVFSMYLVLLLLSLMENGGTERKARKGPGGERYRIKGRYWWELWEALVQLHDSQFPGQVRKTDMNKPLCVSFISGKNLGGEKKKK